jgi:hypothetical protein
LKSGKELCGSLRPLRRKKNTSIAKDAKKVQRARRKTEALFFPEFIFL